MNIISKLIGEKKQWKQYKARKKNLPANYRAAVDALEMHIFISGAETGETVGQALEDLMELFEQGAASRTPIREIVGENPADFAEAFVSNYNTEGWRARQTQKVREALDNAAKM